MCISRIAVVCAAIALTCGFTAPAQEPVQFNGDYLSLDMVPRALGAVQQFQWTGTEDNMAAGDGLLLEGFGVGSAYIPNRRVNQELETSRGASGAPIWQYTYDCEGPNIDGLSVTRIVEPMADEASLRVRWRVENRGEETQWMAPWARNELLPGGTWDAGNRVDVAATDRGVLGARETAYYPAARNWIAATNPEEKETVYGVFDAEATHGFQTVYESRREIVGFQANFTPRMFQPGEVWETTYRVNAVRGLERVDFATDEFAAQIDYNDGRLEVLIAAARSLPPLIIEATVLGDGEDEAWRLPPMRFPTAIGPRQMARIGYDWEAPESGAYELMARFRTADEVYPLGRDTNSPHGGLDTQFHVGEPSPTPMDAWTTAPYALERGSRTLSRDLAAADEAAVWIESPLEKIFQSDRVESTGSRTTAADIAMARNERESFQVVVRPPEDSSSRRVNVRLHDLVHEDGDARISREHIRAANMAYHAAPIPSHYEGPTGEWPDALPAFEPFEAEGGQAAPIWFTVSAPSDIPAGAYRGLLEIEIAGQNPIELWIEADVFDFTLPDQPHLRTDFRFFADRAWDAAQAKGYTGTRANLNEAYLELALDNRVTPRELTALPSESAEYAASLEEFEDRLGELLGQGASSLSVPASLLEFPEQLELANAFIERHGLEDRAFAHLADDPARPAWSRVYDAVETWQDTAPSVPVMVTTRGLEAFLPERVDIWGVHLPMLDTPNNRPILERTA
ncbi:MAG: hypothetical protein ACLFV4_03790, partial [Candidatus Hydrogenedentota bacterium]